MNEKLLRKLYPHGIPVDAYGRLELELDVANRLMAGFRTYKKIYGFTETKGGQIVPRRTRHTPTQMRDAVLTALRGRWYTMQKLADKLGISSSTARIAMDMLKLDGIKIATRKNHGKGWQHHVYKK